MKRLAFAVLIAGCHDPADDVRPIASGTTTTGAGMLTGETIDISLTVENLVSSDPISGAEICLLDEPAVPCAESDAAGRVTITVPAATKLWATLTRDNFVSALVGAVTAEEDLELTAPMLGAAVVPIFLADTGIELDETLGQIAVIAVSPLAPDQTEYPPKAGVSFTLEPPDGDGPHYVNADNQIDPRLEATDARGAGVLFNVAVGDTILSATHPTDSCSAFVARPADEADRYEVKTLPGHITYLGLTCGDPVPADPGAGGTGGAGGA